MKAGRENSNKTVHDQRNLIEQLQSDLSNVNHRIHGAKLTSQVYTLDSTTSGIEHNNGNVNTYIIILSVVIEVECRSGETEGGKGES